MPSTENDVMNGSAPASEIAPLRSCCTPCDSVATTIGLVLLVARKFSASLSMSAPEIELSMVGPLGLDDRAVAVTSTVSCVPATCELHVGADDLARQQLDVARLLGEAVEPRPHAVRAGVQVRHLESPGGVADGAVRSTPVARLVSDDRHPAARRRMHR